MPSQPRKTPEDSCLSGLAQKPLRASSELPYISALYPLSPASSKKTLLSLELLQAILVQQLKLFNQQVLLTKNGDYFNGNARSEKRRKTNK